MGGDDETQPNPEPVPAPSRGELPVGRLVAGKYRIVARIAKGGMARIYQAEQQPLGRIVALKVLAPPNDAHQDPSFQQRFFLEASLCAKLKHPNTVTIFDYGHSPEDGCFYIAMELVEGRTLQDVIKTEGPLPAARAVQVAREIARSLGEAHKHNVVHRDLKPSNVMLVQGAEGEAVKVLDFGVAKVLQSDGEGLTLDDRIVGSPRYMSPEQIRNVDLDGRTDLYSLGVVMYEMLTGRAPFVNDKTIQLLVMHLNDPVPPLKAPWPVPPRVEALVLRCLEKEPERRPADIREFRSLLEQALGDVPHAPTSTAELTAPFARPSSASVGGDSTPTLDRPEEGRRSLVPGVLLVGIGLTAAGAAVAALVVVLVLVMGWPAEAPPPPAPVVPDPVVVAPDPPPPAAPRTSTLTIRSVPDGAEVWEGDRRHGVAPIGVELREGDAPRTFELRAPGHRAATLVEPFGESAERTVTLERVPRPRPAPSKKPPGDDDIRIER